MRFRKWWHTMVAHDLAELSLVIVETLRPLLHLSLKSHAPRRTHYISPEPTQPRARPEPRSYCIRFHRLVYGFPRRPLLETVWKVLRTSQPPDHEPRHRRVDKCLSGGAQPLVVFGHPPVVADPREGALHHPPPRQHCETSRGQKLLPVHLLAFFGPLLCPELGYLLREWLSRLAHDLDAQTQYLLGPPSAPSSVAGIDP